MTTTEEGTDMTRGPRPGDLPAGATWDDGRTDERARANGAPDLLAALAASIARARAERVPVSSATVAALDLDAIEDRAKRAAWGWGAEWTAVEDDIEEWSTVHADGNIAGMDPATTLALVAEVRRLRDDVGGLRRWSARLSTERGDFLARAEAAEGERDALRAKVAALRVAVSHSAESCADGPCEFHETVARAESAEVEVARLRAKVVAVEATVADLALRGAPGHDDSRTDAEHRYGIRTAVARLRDAPATTGEGK